MYLTILLSFSLFLAWIITHYIVSWTPLVEIIETILSPFFPVGFVTLVTYVPHATLVALYFILVKPGKSEWFKSHPFWEYFRRNMTVSGQSRHDFQVIYAVCPHGVYGEASTIYFVLNHLYKRVVPVATSVLFYIPFVRELAYLAGAIPANTASISRVLDEGKSILILPEGLRGHLHPENDLRVLKGCAESPPRKGFIRLALTAKTHKTLKIVPVWIEGIEKMYSTYYPVLWLQKILLKNYYYCWPMLHWPIFPRTHHPIHIRFGRPISLTGGEVDQVFHEFVQEMEYLKINR